MGNLFCANEVIEMGIQIKNDGKDFYVKIAESSRANKVKDIFRWLAEQQDRHIKAFEDILASVEKCVPYEAYPGEYSAYLGVLVGDHTLGKEKKPKKFAQKVKDNAEAIDLAIDFEKDSVLFYHEMKNVVREKERMIIDELIKHEQEHIRRLSALKECLTSSELNACLVG